MDIELCKLDVDPLFFNCAVMPQMRLQMLTGNENGAQLLFEASSNIPQCDVDYVNQMSGDGDVNPNLKAMLAVNRLLNPICEECGYKTDTSKLMLCKKCKLSWFCNNTCAEKNHAKHSRRCCNVNGPLDNGYQAITLLERKK